MGGETVLRYISEAMDSLPASERSPELLGAYANVQLAVAAGGDWQAAVEAFNALLREGADEFVEGLEQDNEDQLDRLVRQSLITILGGINAEKVAEPAAPRDAGADD